MNDDSLTNSRIVAAYRGHTPGSADLAERARERLPSGIVHDSRQLDPYAVYVDRALGPRKWDVDGNEYVDYYGGHGSLLLGHCHPAVMKAVHQQLDRGTHYGACHELEVRWAELVCELVPCAERVRFTSSGTEANLMALRLARAHTGKTALVRMKGHFHGWQDHVTSGYDGHFDGSPTPGVLAGITDQVIIAPPDDIDATTALLESRDDIAAVILEPTGGNFGVVPMSRDYVAKLRDVTAARGVVLIFDEVVTGFRVAPGGAQEHYGITPDLATFAKVLAGGLPGGAVAGRRDLMDRLDFEASRRSGLEKIGHQGTFNANPVSAAAGIACLSVIADSDACRQASASAAMLRGALNAVFAEAAIPWAAYGEHSAIYVFTNPGGLDVDPQDFDASAMDAEIMRTGGKHPATAKFRLALLLNGVDMSGKPGGITSCTHGEDEVRHTAQAVRKAVTMLKEEGELS